MTISLAGLTPQQLRHAADIKEKIASLQNELNKLSGTPAETEALPEAEAPRKKWKMSAAGRAKIAAAARARWAGIKATKIKAPRRTWKMSAAAKAAISAAAKARWAKIKAGK
jgi:hypothetical protein